MTQLEKAYDKETARAIMSGCNTKFIFNPGEYESAKYFSDYLGDEEVHYRQKSRSSSKDGGSTNSSEQDKTKKILAPEEVLKLPAGHCIFINPSYTNGKEASIPLKFKIIVGEGEMKRRAYGEANFHLVMKELQEQRQHSKITNNDIHKRVDVLSNLIPSEAQREEVRSRKVLEILSRNGSLKR